MAFYLVRAKVRPELLPELRNRLDGGEIGKLTPFGIALEKSLAQARVDAGGIITWEEEDNDTPPLTKARKAVLDMYFTDLKTEAITAAGKGWERIKMLPYMWQV